MQEARVYAEENGLFFMETSAKTAANVNEIFYEIGASPLNVITYVLGCLTRMINSALSFPFISLVAIN